MSDVLSIAIKIAAFSIPTLFGVVSGLIGARAVRTLRIKTGDDSMVTNVLSGEVFRHHHREAA